MTRVAYVCADPGIPVFGTKGASVHIQEIIRAWRSRGADVEIFAVRRGDDIPADLADVPVHIVPVDKGRDARGGKRMDPADRELAQREAAHRMTRLVVAAAPDVVYERYSLFSTIASSVKQALGFTAILEVNAPLIDEQRTHRHLVDEAGALAALRAQAGAADVVACVSEPVADWVRATAELPSPDTVLVVPNGVNTRRILPVAPVEDAGADPVVVFVGTLKPWHGVEDLIEAATASRGRWTLRLIGDGPQRATIEQIAAERGLSIDLVGAVPPEQIPDALQGASVAVAPYPESSTQDHYFSPLKVYEYAAAGLPVVASRIGQIPQIVQDGRTGLLVPPSDPQALAEAIDGLVARPDLARSMGIAGRHLMVAQHSWDRVLDATVAPIGHRAAERAEAIA